MNHTGSERRLPAPDGFYGCARCLTIKPVSEFHRYTNGPDGHASVCKVCKKAVNAEARARVIAAGDPTAEERFWAKVNKNGPNGCWQWTGSISDQGYGYIVLMGKTGYAHRYSVKLHGREIPRGMFVDHMCRNRACVNPDHLRVVTPRQNVTENNDSPLSLNARKTHCPKGHPYSPENTAIKDTFGPKGTPLKQRLCLTCFPSNWRFAVIPRDAPPGSRNSV